MAGTEPDPWMSYGAPQQFETSGLAVASLVLSFLPTCGVGSILAVMLGLRARQEIDAPGSMKTGRGMATTGIVFGCIGLVASMAVVILVATAVISGAVVR